MKPILESVPLLLRPFVFCYAYFFGYLQYIYFSVIHKTMSVQWSGQEYLQLHKHYILACWHCYYPCYTATFLTHRANFVWMLHPLFYMAHIWVLLKKLGVKTIVLGSSGHGGREAAGLIAEEIKKGACFAIAPDGPGGPWGILKKGTLHLSAQTGVPVIPIHFEPSPAFRLLGSDRKYFPLPFSKMHVTVGTPVFVNADNMEQASQLITQLLGNC